MIYPLAICRSNSDFSFLAFISFLYPAYTFPGYPESVKVNQVDIELAKKMSEKKKIEFEEVTIEVPHLKPIGP